MDKKEAHFNERVRQESIQETEEKSDIVVEGDLEQDQTKAEFYKDFRDSYGVSFSKDEMLESSAEEQVNFMSASGMKVAQFLISKGRKMEEYSDLLKKFKAENPEALLSIHSSAPSFGGSIDQLVIKNEPELLQTFSEAVKAGCELVTIHPVAMEMDVWEKQDQENQAQAIKTMAGFYARSVVEAGKAGKKLELAIENLPAKGQSGKWGQTPEQISAVLEQSREILVFEYGFKTQEAIEAIGMTLDIGHALFEENEAESVITKWFKELGQDIKCFHIGDPAKLKLLREMCEKFNIKAPVFLESKQAIETTQAAYNSSRNELNEY